MGQRRASEVWTLKTSITIAYEYEFAMAHSYGACYRHFLLSSVGGSVNNTHTHTHTHKHTHTHTQRERERERERENFFMYR
jgi:hypothetical protein